MESSLKTNESTDETIKLESQFILRLPEEVSDNIKKILKKKPKKIKKHMKLDMNPETRLGTLTFNKHTLPLKLVDLPCVLESMKSIDGKIFFKTADIHQMFLVSEEDMGEKVVWPHGITPPMKNVRKNRWRKTMENKQPLDGPEIEKEVKWLLKVDNEAICVRWELVDDDKCGKMEGNDSDVVDERYVFGETIDSLTEDEEYDQEDEEDVASFSP